MKMRCKDIICVLLTATRLEEILSRSSYYFACAMHNNNRHRVNLFSDIVATLRRACRGRNSLCTWKSLRYTSRRVVSTQKTALLAVAAAHPSDIPSGNAAVICGTGKRNNIKESSAIKESCFVLRFYVVDSLVVTTMRGEILKSIVSTTTRRAAPRRDVRNTVHKGQRNCTDHRTTGHRWPLP